MSFTVSQLLKRTNFPDKHKLKLGRRIAESFRSLHPEDVIDYAVETDKEGDRFEVNLYPEYFKPHALKVVGRYGKTYWGKKGWELKVRPRKRVIKNKIV